MDAARLPACAHADVLRTHRRPPPHRTTATATHYHHRLPHRHFDVQHRVRADRRSYGLRLPRYYHLPCYRTPQRGLHRPVRRHLPPATTVVARAGGHLPTTLTPYLHTPTTTPTARWATVTGATITVERLQGTVGCGAIDR